MSEHAIPVSSANPPAAHPTLNVGITGHRTHDLDAAQASHTKLTVCVQEVLQQIAAVARRNAAVNGRPDPRMRLLSPLAEGADRIAAHAALDLDFELHVPMPFLLEDYEADFATTRNDFRALLERADIVVELDGSRRDADALCRSYEAVGELVVEHADILLAIWNPDEKESGRGGTASVMRLACRHSLPVIWIDARPEHHAKTLRFDAEGRPVEEPIIQALDRMSDRMTPTHRTRSLAPDVAKERADPLQTYLNEHERKWNAGLPFELFQLLLGCGTHPRIRVAPIYENARAQWDKAWRAAPDLASTQRQHLDDRFFVHYAWADHLATHYAQVQRSTTIAMAVLGVIAVALALSGGLTQTFPLFLIEFAVIGAILVLMRPARAKDRKRRIIDYRILAETLRHQFFSRPLGRIGPNLQPEAFGPECGGWVVRHVRSIALEAGLFPAVLDPTYVDRCRPFVETGLVIGRSDDEIAKAKQSHLLDARLDRLGFASFGLAAAVSAALLFGWSFAGLNETGPFSGPLIFLAGFLPALGTAAAAIRSQGDFSSIALRSSELARALHDKRDWINSSEGPRSGIALGAAVVEVARLLSAETRNS